MFKTESEIFNQYEALKKTYAHLLGMKKEILEFKNKFQFGKILYTGCGSSYSLCKSGAMVSRFYIKTP